ncbi:hypothetical protein FIBSPDRAFT_356486 [Athelia psychrophila]|uniref:Uncharacterized protein n=1 Tax=Athelia psychrophila TaxID=1759441 RepID=A0A167VS47_9AGAM|nr:hypothetical protein FIBSPDRAFT_356486 [Fibularhizoctonia sp. CBS 109695]
MSLKSSSKSSSGISEVLVFVVCACAASLDSSSVSRLVLSLVYIAAVSGFLWLSGLRVLLILFCSVLSLPLYRLLVCTLRCLYNLCNSLVAYEYLMTPSIS